MSNRRVRTGLILIGLLFIAALLAPLCQDPNVQTGLESGHNAAPSGQHLLGTDHLNRDVLSRVLHGARISLWIALLSVLMALTVGTVVGMTAGYAGGIIDVALMRVVDGALAIPRVFLLVLVVALWQGSGVNTLVLVLTLGLTSWFETSRLVRAQVLSVKALEFVTASRALGLTPARVVLRHILPSVRAPILVAGTLGVGNMVLAETALSYLGLGVAPPTASLGNMIHDGEQLLQVAPWIALMPGLFIILTVLSFSVLSEGLREGNDPGASTS